MSYKIAIASSDGENVDVHFGAAEQFYIYEVEETKYQLAEVRKYETAEDDLADHTGSSGGISAGCSSGTDGGVDTSYVNNSESDCGDVTGCGAGTGGGCGAGNGSGCGSGAGGLNPRVELISDCRCVVCTKIGFHVQKQLEKLAIVSFDVTTSVSEALDKITFYFNRVDKHESLRGCSLK